MLGSKLFSVPRHTLHRRGKSARDPSTLVAERTLPVTELACPS
jgi:hypothetical protein